VEILTVDAVTTAVCHARVTHADLGKAIGECLDEVWTFIRAAGDLEPNNSIVLYLGDPGAGPAPVEMLG
jgi:hypothetical protein